MVVEGEDVRDAVDEHRGHEPGIVCVLAEGRRRRHEPLPCGEHGWGVVEKGEELLQRGQLYGGLGSRPPQAVCADRPRADGPELLQHLGHENEAVAEQLDRRRKLTDEDVYAILGLPSPWE